MLFIGEAPIPAARAATQQERRQEPQHPVPAPSRSVPAPRRGSDDDGDGVDGKALLTLALKLELLRVLVEHGAGMNILFSMFHFV